LSFGAGGEDAMWSARSEELADACGVRFALAVDSRPATFADVLRGWQGDTGFRALFNALLADAPFASFRWEMPAVTAATVARPFKCVLLDSPGLARRLEPEAFAEHFAGAVGDVVTFTNLGGDAILVVPCPVAEASAYGHLAAFVRLAPEQQRQALWRLVGEAMLQRVGAKPVWLSTAGAGVAWLHVRLDDQPKYYGYAAYRRSAEYDAAAERPRDWGLSSLRAVTA
jgi:hypothetical protein